MREPEGRSYDAAVSGFLVRHDRVECGDTLTILDYITSIRRTGGTTAGALGATMRSWSAGLCALVCAMTGLGDSAKADFVSEVLACKAVVDNLERLTCYDRAVRENANINSKPDPLSGNVDVSKTQSESPETDEAALGDWMVDRELSPIDDSQAVYLSKVNEEWLADRSVGGESTTLVIRCKENETSVMVATSEFLGISDSVPITVRFDSSAAQRQTWNSSTSYRSAFAPQPIKLIKQLLEANQFVVRLEKYGGGNITVTFRLEGLANLIGDVQSACHWQ